MAIRVAINGFGRIGRLVLRAIVDRGQLAEAFRQASGADRGCHRSTLRLRRLRASILARPGAG